MASSDSASSLIPNTRQNSNNCGGAAINEYKSKYIAEYIRNTIVSRNRNTLNKQRSTLTVVRDTYMSVFHTSFALFTSLTQFIHLKWLLNILYHVSLSYLVILTQIKHWLMFYSVNCDRHISPRKNNARGQRD